MRRLAAFVRGVWEFRLPIPRAHGVGHLDAAYDRGREFAHRVTLGRWGP